MRRRVASLRHAGEWLRRWFRHEDFRPDQQAAVAAALDGRDVAVYWHTGKGKSLCYQLPAVHQPGKVALVA